MEFETDRLILRPTLVRDADIVLAILTSKKFIQFVGNRNVKSLKEAEAYVKQRMMPQLERLGFSNYSILRKKDGLKLGFVGLYDRAELEGVDIGFALLPEHEGKGYAYEASKAMLNAAFETFKLDNVQAITNKDNYRSQRLLKKLGLKISGEITLDGEDQEILILNISKEDYQSD